ncbi:hypothetical protein EYC80_007168 [Monilinia laxa]|uniref:Uncharacterized protein n=1 Tax=Monilinia laxa TaxID=61186 RepID=A0A5N6K0D8_MONLA|nr:hypothetical protein EYC80_007168 [Monilinia laxa]
MIASTFTMQLLAVMAVLFASVFANPIKRSDSEVTPLSVPGLLAIFTTIARSDLSTGELVGVVIISSQTVYVQEPNFFPAIVWGVPEVTPSTTGTLSTGTLSAATLPTATFPVPVSQNSTSATPNACTDDVVPTPAPTATPIVNGTSAVTTSSKTCNTDVAGVTIPVSDLTIGEFVIAYVTCGKTIYIQEPNFYSPKTYYGIPASTIVTTTAAASTTGVAVKPRMLEARIGNIPAVHRTRPTLLRQADEDRIHSIPSGVAGNRAAAVLKQKGGMRKRIGVSLAGQFIIELHKSCIKQYEYPHMEKQARFNDLRF